jgi:hypothetical protein
MTRKKTWLRVAFTALPAFAAAAGRLRPVLRRTLPPILPIRGSQRKSLELPIFGAIISVWTRAESVLRSVASVMW